MEKLTNPAKAKFEETVNPLINNITDVIHAEYCSSNYHHRVCEESEKSFEAIRIAANTYDQERIREAYKKGWGDAEKPTFYLAHDLLADKRISRQEVFKEFKRRIESNEHHGDQDNESN